MKFKEVKKFSNPIDTSIDAKFKYKMHLATHGPGLHSEFKFSIKSIPSDEVLKPISISVSNTVFSSLADRTKREPFGEYEYNLLLKDGFEKGILDFMEYLITQELNISTGLEIEVFEYYFHPVDSKPKANERGLSNALKCVFEQQLGFERTKYDNLEEIN